MQGYQHILVAIDLSQEAKSVIDRAIDLAQRYQARLSLVHVVEPILVENSYDMMLSLPAELDTALIERAKAFLDGIKKEKQLEQAECYVEIGSVKNEISRLANEHGADLIVLGTHGRHGVGLLLGSTANAVLHGTPCDVHAVRIKE